MNTEPWAIGLVLIAGLIGGFGPIYLKEGAERIDLRNILGFFKNYFLIIGIGIYVVGEMLYIPALKGGELSVLYPFVGLVYVWVSIYSIILLKEKMSLTKWFGVMTIILGIIFIGFGA